MSDNICRMLSLGFRLDLDLHALLAVVGKGQHMFALNCRHRAESPYQLQPQPQAPASMHVCMYGLQFFPFFFLSS